MERFLLIGGSGFLGSNLGRAMMDRGHEIVVVDPLPPHWDTEAYRGRGTHVPTTLTDPDEFGDILIRYKIDIVIYLASRTLPGSSMEECCQGTGTQFELGIRLLDRMMHAGVQRFAFMSSGGSIYGNQRSPNREIDPPAPLNYYGWSKHAFEELIRVHSRLTPLKYLIFRPSNPYGRFQMINGAQGLISVIYGKILSGEKLSIWGDGSVVRDYIYIDDFCSSILALLGKTRWNETYNIGSGIGTSVREVVELACAITGKLLQVEYLPGRPIDTPNSVLDISQLCSSISFSPLTLEEGMTRYWQELQRKL